ncbi:AAEL006475-PA [Aedes aegypti]|uniref:AAEL006475-PA n=1 Tax=Aedes aegypti TaxID=7159 RepID=Q175Z5_AEDAE|nr:AAEL006475-PA [Aedes aegypti]
MDGDGEDDGTEKSEPQSRSPRIREYPVGAKGPFIVYFRKIAIPLKVLLISSELYSKFTSIKELKKINEFKVRVVLSKREEANEIVKMDRFEGVYRVYIPCEDVEVDGVIYDEVLTPEEVMQLGEGRFRNRALPSVPVLDCERLTMMNADKSNRVHSNALRITFAGTMIPDFVNVSNVFIPAAMILSQRAKHTKK